MINRLGLLFFADLPANAGVDVYVATRQHPLAPEQYVEVRQGQLISFVGQGSEAPALHSLAVMLQTPLVWDEGPAFPPDGSGTSYRVTSQ